MNSRTYVPDQPVFSASDLVASHRKSGDQPRFPIPKGVILGYQRHVGDYAKRKGFKIQEFHSPGDFYIQNSTSRSIGLAVNFGIGAPASVTQLEILAALGVQEFISIGLAGSLQDHLKAGDLVICQDAIRDEGTSRYYLQPGRFVGSSEALTSRLCTFLGKRPYTMGTSWTTDAPFRERRSRVKDLQRCGVTTVEMEAAALFAAGQFLNKSVAAAFSISDNLTTDPANGISRDGSAFKSLEHLLDAAVEALTL